MRAKKANRSSCGKYNQTKIWGKSIKQKRQFSALSKQLIFSKFYQEQWISHTSKHFINCPATLPPEITEGRKADTKPLCTKKATHGKNKHWNPNFQTSVRMLNVPLKSSSPPNKCFEPLVTGVVYLEKEIIWQVGRDVFVFPYTLASITTVLMWLSYIL